MDRATFDDEHEKDPAEAARIERLQAFTDVVLEKRKKAIDGRAASGMERTIQEDEEFYDGIDDANRDEMAAQKSVAPGGPITTEVKRKSTKSTVFLNFTQTYVDMAAAAVADMLLPTDDMPFGVDPTPEPDLIKAKEATEPFRILGPDGKKIVAEDTAGSIATQMIAEATESAKKAEKQIWDWLTEAQWHTEVRTVIDDAAKIGTGVLKGPVPDTIRVKKIDRHPDTGKVSISILQKVVPVSKQISVKNLYPDPACGEDIQRGSYIWECDTISTRALRDLKDQLDPDGNPLYLNAQIDKVLEEGPDKRYTDGTPQREVVEADEYRIWYMHGMAEPSDFEAAGCSCPKGRVFPIKVTVVNDSVIMVARSMFDSGAFPYDVMTWQRVPGKWWGKGEARKLRTPQRMLNGGARAMLNNAGLSSGPQIIINSDLIEPADGNPEITPLKLWRKKAGVEMDDVAKAIMAINIDSQQEKLLNIIRFAIESADKIATMPIQQQGQQGVTQETAEGRRLLQNNAAVTKRRLAKIFDGRITEPHIGRYYEWILLWGEDESMKRDFVIDARASSALFERDQQNVFIATLGNLVKDPAFGLSPRKWALETLKSNKLDPKRFELDDEEKEQLANQQPPEDPRIEAAKITAEARLKVAQVDTDRDTKYVESQDRRDQNAHEARMTELTLKRELAMLDYANNRGMTLDKVKGELAKTAMTLKVQERLANNPPKGAPEVARPRVEPKGRAPKGESFQK